MYFLTVGKLLYNVVLVSAVCVLVAQSCLTLCDPIDYSLPGSSVHGIFQARMLEWWPFPSPGDLADPGVEPSSPALAGRFFTAEPPGKPNSCLSTFESILGYLIFSRQGS